MNIRKCYKTLDVGYGASMEEVRQGYKDLVRVWHPDRFADDPRLRKKAEEKLKEINGAYGDLMASVSQKTRMMPDTGLQLSPPWWRRRSSWGIGVVATRISRAMYARACNNLNRNELGRIFQALFNSENGAGPEGIGKEPVENFPGNGTQRAGPDGFQKGMDFSSIFDELARERRAQSKREDPANR